MSFLQKARRGGKDAFLGTLHAQLRQQAVNELASGKLKSPTKLDDLCARVIPAWRKNPFTSAGLKAFGITDEELRRVLRDALTEVGVELK